jgi:hypothetical protein
MNTQGHWFRSTRFEIEPGEDDEINPGIYGKQLAEWLKARLEDHGYKVEPVINEDWGRCLMCSRKPFLLWVGCARACHALLANRELSMSSAKATQW